MTELSPTVETTPPAKPEMFPTWADLAVAPSPCWSSGRPALRPSHRVQDASSRRDCDPGAPHRPTWVPPRVCGSEGGDRCSPGPISAPHAPRSCRARLPLQQAGGPSSLALAQRSPCRRPDLPTFPLNLSVHWHLMSVPGLCAAAGVLASSPPACGAASRGSRSKPGLTVPCCLPMQGCEAWWGRASLQGPALRETPEAVALTFTVSWAGNGSNL